MLYVQAEHRVRPRHRLQFGLGAFVLARGIVFLGRNAGAGGFELGRPGGSAHDVEVVVAVF